LAQVNVPTKLLKRSEISRRDPTHDHETLNGRRRQRLPLPWSPGSIPNDREWLFTDADVKVHAIGTGSASRAERAFWTVLLAEAAACCTCRLVGNRDSAVHATVVDLRGGADSDDLSNRIERS
jgi:hypothetical protein